jgi:hypothetical protein
MFARATQYKTTVMSADQLSGLCRQRAKTPLGLDDYRSLFATGGSLDIQAVDERAEEVKRLVTLAAAICEAIRDQSTVFGRLSARDLLLILSGKTVAEGTTVDELQALLDTLANPLLAVLNGSKIDGYRVTTRTDTGQAAAHISRFWHSPSTSATNNSGSSVAEATPIVTGPRQGPCILRR